MAVVINEFEIVPEPAQKESSGDQQAEPTPVTPHDITAVVRKQMERALRVWAH